MAGYSAFTLCRKDSLALLISLTDSSIPKWFGAGAIIFPLSVWIISIPGAYFIAGDAIWEPAGILPPAIFFVGFLLANRYSAKERIKASKKRLDRNRFIPHQLTRLDKVATEAAVQNDSDELDLESLRKLQFLFDQAFQSLDDWSGFTRIDQFQTASLRYQIYQMMYCLGLYQSSYAPNAHGYINEAFRRVIERSLTPDVLNFWKWERLAGKFSFDSDPVRKDNIMVTGFLLQGVMLYTANTGDMRYTKSDSLAFRIEEGVTYKYGLHDLQATLLRQWSINPYCLIPCEPNWIYVMCNLQGMAGAVVYDRVFGTKSTDVMLPIFEELLNTNFTDFDGSVLPIRSELTGFTIPGLCGASGDLAATIMSTGPLRNLSRRLWAITREETIQFNNETREIRLRGLVGADVIDQGNYQKNVLALLPYTALAAAEHGDRKLKEAALEKIEQGWGYVTTPSGARSLDLSKASTLMNYVCLTATLVRPGAYHQMIQTVGSFQGSRYPFVTDYFSRQGPTKAALNGPILSEVPYPGVLVAKAISNSSRDLELVLYPSADPGTFKLVVSRLKPGNKYICKNETLVADDQGNLLILVFIDKRTHLHIYPADK